MKKRILCFGDSNTWGAIPQESNRYPENIRWTGVLQNELGKNYQIIEEGHNGRTTVFDDVIEWRLSGLKYFMPCCSSQSPLDLIILMLGTNDLKTRFGVDARSIAYGLQRYLDVLSITPMDGNKPKVLIVSPILIDPTYKNDLLFYDIFGENADIRSQGFAKAYSEFAENAGLAFLDASLYGKASSLDGVHMDANSHNKLGKAIAKKVKEILESP